MSINFSSILAEVSNRLVLDHSRAQMLYKWVTETQTLDGDLAECGAFRGGSAKLICKTIQHKKTLHLFDTFDGIPASQRQDGEHHAGDFTCGKDEVAAYLQDCPNIKIYEGLVPDTLEAVKDLTFSFVHLDMDIYFPTIKALNFFWPRISLGGVIILDDVQGLYGITEAIREFSEQENLIVHHTVHEQALFQK
jgi:hypothetical protein